MKSLALFCYRRRWYVTGAWVLLLVVLLMEHRRLTQVRRRLKSLRSKAPERINSTGQAARYR